MTTIALQSRMKWGTFNPRSRSGVAGLLPLRHLGSTDSFAPLDMRLGLSRHLRPLTRREAPAHGPVEAPGSLLGGRLPGRGCGRVPLAVSGQDLFGARGRSPRGTEPALRAGAATEPLLPLQRALRRAGLGGPGDARVEARGERGHRSR